MKKKKEREITNACEDEKKREPLYTVSENVNWYKLQWKTSCSFLQKLTKRTTI